MKIIFAGGRNVEWDRAAKLVQSALEKSGWKTSLSEVVHGGARGIDSGANLFAKGVWPIKIFPADWDKFGKRAGPLRNRQMAEYADALIAIWDGESRGTKNMIDEATRRGLPVFIYRYEKAPSE